MVETLRCTPDHPFFVPGQGWVAAGELTEGSHIVSQAGPKLTVGSIDWQRVAVPQFGQAVTGPLGYTVYNFEVKETHSYFVGTANGGTWVHNNCVKHFPSFDAARRAAFEDLGMTNPTDVTRGLEDASGTVTEFHGPNGEKIAYDGPHRDMDPAKGHDKPHVLAQFPGKRYKGGPEKRWNYTYDGPAGPSRPSG